MNVLDAAVGVLFDVCVGAIALAFAVGTVLWLMERLRG